MDTATSFKKKIVGLWDFVALISQNITNKYMTSKNEFLNYLKYNVLSSYSVYVKAALIIDI